MPLYSVQPLPRAQFDDAAHRAQAVGLGLTISYVGSTRAPPTSDSTAARIVTSGPRRLGRPGTPRWLTDTSATNRRKLLPTTLRSQARPGVQIGLIAPLPGNTSEVELLVARCWKPG